MTPAADMAVRHAAILGELAEIGLTVARALQARVLEAETTEEAARAADSLHKVSRTVRQSLALEARFARDIARLGREDEDRTESRRKAQVRDREAQVRASVERLIWTEVERWTPVYADDVDYEDDDEAREQRAEALTADLDYHLGELARDPGFLTTAPATHVCRLAADLGLNPRPAYADST